MKKVAVFGKPANGKSTLSKRLAAATGIPLYPVDALLYQPSGLEVGRQQYEAAHDEVLASDEWIIEGFGPLSSLASFNRRLEAADTLVYIELPYWVTYWLVTKRLLKSVFKKPEGWPEGCSVFKGTLQSYKVLQLCPGFWNDDFLQRVEKLSEGKTLHVIRSVSELNRFVAQHVK